MAASFPRLAATTALLVALAGCAVPGVPEGEGDGTVASWPRCEHPWPCGDGSEWPAGLEGPFDILPPEPVRVASFDGVELDGAVWLPQLPEGVRAPVVLKSTPYLGTCPWQNLRGALDGEVPACYGSADSEARLDGDNFRALLEAGYAVAIFAVRGTGASGGCHDLWGDDEQRDQAALVAWAAAQPWSNGRVAMTGLSYPGTTPWEAAVQSPPGLKAILVGGIITDVYLSLSTPQGAVEDGYDLFQVSTAAANSLQPPHVGGADMLARWAPVAKDRLCPETAAIMTVNTQTGRADERPEAWFAERRFADRLGDVTAAVLVAHGLLDDNFHRYQEDTIWHRLPGPKWFVLGQWGHTYDFAEQMAGNPHAASWLDLQRAWLDFWLKGLGEPPRMGAVDYQDASMAWREATAWPPPDAREEVLHLAGDALSPEPGGGARSFSAAPQGSCAASQTCGAVNTLCPSVSPVPPSVVYAVEATTAATVAGNPFLLLDVESDQAGGTFAVDLYRIPKGAPCEDAIGLSNGGVDLRFHEGNFRAEPFPTGTRTPVRVDLYNVAVRLEPGDRLALVVRNPGDRDTREHAPTITVHGASHVVLPLVEGTLGGAPPTLTYPPRPFAPGASG